METAKKIITVVIVIATTACKVIELLSKDNCR